MWDHRPSAGELLRDRLSRGWVPTPSLLREGQVILGHAACVAGAHTSAADARD